jgi:hypothetical protein
MKAQKPKPTDQDGNRRIFDEWIEDKTHQIDAALEGGEINKREHAKLNSALKGIRFIAGAGNAYLTSIFTTAFWNTVHQLQKPVLIASILSDANRKAVKARYDQIWTDDKKKSLRREYKEGLGKFQHPTTHYKHLARRILNDVDKWRQIRRIIENPDA